MKFTKLLRNKKAISPIFATLILIAIAVIAGIVVYMFTSGTISSMTGSGTAGQEKASVQAVDATGTTIIVYANSVAGGEIKLTGAIVKDMTGNTEVASAETWSDTLAAGGALETIDTGIATTGLSSGETYTVTLTSAKGGSFVSSSFVAP